MMYIFTPWYLIDVLWLQLLIAIQQYNIREITEILMNTLASFFVQPLFCALNFYFGRFHGKFEFLMTYSIFATEKTKMQLFL